MVTCACCFCRMITAVCVLQGDVHEHISFNRNLMWSPLFYTFLLYAVMLRALLVLLPVKRCPGFPPDLCPSFTTHFPPQYVNLLCGGSQHRVLGNTNKRDRNKTLEWPRVRECPLVQLVKQLQRQQQYQVSRVEPEPSAPESQSKQQEDSQACRREREIRREEVCTVPNNVRVRQIQ